MGFRLGWLPLSLLGLMLGCGSRSDLLRAGLFCESDSDCQTGDLCALARCEAGQCLPSDPKVCESADPCEIAECNPSSGACERRHVTPDEDKDGYFAPLPDFPIGDSRACGNDCDDTSPLAFPGGYEVCDGVDNDCDGVVDNGRRLLPLPDEVLMTPVRIAEVEDGKSGAAGIAFGDGVFALGYRARGRVASENHSYIQGRTPDGSLLFPETAVASVNVGSYGTPLAWSGSHFGAAWPDARAGEYHIYFTLFDATGAKRLTDFQLTESGGKPWDADLIYDQGRFVVVWQESRGRTFQIKAQILSSAGDAIGSNEELTPDDKAYEAATLAASPYGYGLVYSVTSLNVDLASDAPVGVEFRSFTKDLAQLSAPLSLAADIIGTSSITTVGESYVVTWAPVDGDGIWGAVLSAFGDVLVSPKRITAPMQVTRKHGLLSFGDRVFLAWGGFDGGRADLFATVFDANLVEVEEPTLLVGGPWDSLDPRLARGDSGAIGVLFNDFREGVEHAHFMSLGCVLPPSK